MAVKTMMTELKWFLKGDTNIKYLVDNGCNIWNGDAYKSYQNAIVEVGLFDTMMDQEEFIGKIKTDDEFAQKWGELGPIYGKQWRDWNGFEINSGAQMEGYNKPFITANHPFYKFTPVKNSIYGKNQNFGTGVLMSFNNKQNNQYHPFSFNFKY
jgi:hypothetical protein